MLIHPQFDPYIFSIGKIHATWYGLMYVLGFYGAYLLGSFYAKKYPDWGWDKKELSDLLFYLMLGVVLGGRIGYVLFYLLIPYGFGLLIKDPFLLFRVWEGGMSFHGGLLGVVIAGLCFAKKFKKNPLDIGDFISPLVPIGLFFGRIGNFINGELWGKTTDLPWGMVFYSAPDLSPRHPSQIYEALWEGVLLFIIGNFFANQSPRKRGKLTGLFLAIYALGRFLIEFVREKDSHMNYYFSLTMGQLLSLPMFLIGIYFIFRKLK